jgi:hypothetical protein
MVVTGARDSMVSFSFVTDRALAVSLQIAAALGCRLACTVYLNGLSN